MAGYTYQSLPDAERAVLPSEERVAAALDAPVEVDGQQMTIAGYLHGIGARDWLPADD